MKTDISNSKLNHEQAARPIVAAFIGAAKKINLYSESHGVYHRALKNLKDMLDAYFDLFGNFRIHIQRNKIIYGGEILYEGDSETCDPVFLLHRDGIQWLEFQVDLELYEIDAFIRNLHDHSLLSEEPEDDIVTALWELNLPSIAYEAADLELDYQDNLNFESESRTSAQNSGMEDNKAIIQSESIYSSIATLISSAAGKEDPLQLSAEERKRLREMIAAEEKLDGSDYVMDALLYILEEHPSEKDIEALLETLLQELREILKNTRYDYLLQTFLKLKKIANRHARLKWIKTQLDTLFANLSSGLFLNGLLRNSVDIPHVNDTQLEDLKSFLLMLNPSAILGLAPIARNIRSAKMRHMIMGTIRCMAASDFGPLEKLIAESDADLIVEMVAVLGVLTDLRSRKMLINLLRHPSERVRMQAIKTLLTRDKQAISEIFPLIDDPDERIRTFVLKRLGRRRCGVVEGRILKYLKAYRSGEKDSDHFFAVCHTLGKCGSDRSIPYLTQLLFRWPTMGILRPAGSPLRKGAVAALKVLRTQKAAMLVERHQQGFFRNILRAVPLNSFGREAGEH